MSVGAPNPSYGILRISGYVNNPGSTKDMLVCEFFTSTLFSGDNYKNNSLFGEPDTLNPERTTGCIIYHNENFVTGDDVAYASAVLPNGGIIVVGSSGGSIDSGSVVRAWKYD